MAMQKSMRRIHPLGGNQPSRHHATLQKLHIAAMAQDTLDMRHDRWTKESETKQLILLGL